MSTLLLGKILSKCSVYSLFYYDMDDFVRFIRKFTAFSLMQTPLAVFASFILYLFLFSTNVHAEERALRPFEITDLPGAGFTVYIPERPKWNMNLESRNNETVVTLTTPAQYYPPASMEIVLNRHLRITNDELPDVAITALNTVRDNAGVQSGISIDALRHVQYGQINAYEDNYEIRSAGKVYSVKSVMGVMPSGKPITMFLVTPQGQLTHISHMAKKIWDHLTEYTEKRPE